MSLPEVFISYTTKDENGKRFAAELRRILCQSNYDVFLFDHSKREHLGADLWYLLTKEIAKRQVLLVVCTHAIIESRGVRFEISQALERSKLIVPLKLDGAPVPDPIVIYVRERFDERDYESVFASVAKGLSKSYEEHVQNMEKVEEESERFRRTPPVMPRIVETPAGGDQLLDTIVTAYRRDSVVEYVSVLENFDVRLHSALTFGVIAKRALAIPRDCIGDPSHHIPVDYLGSSVSWGERNHLRDLWCEHVRTEIFPMSKFTFQEFRRILNYLSSGMNPKVLLAPIDMFVKFMSIIRSAPLEVNALKWDTGESFFILEDGRELRILWSNKYAPLDHFVLVDPSATRWRVKPDPITGDPLTAVFVENEKNPTTKIDLLVTTVVNAELVNPNGVRLFKFE